MLLLISYCVPNLYMKPPRSSVDIGGRAAYKKSGISQSSRHLQGVLQHTYPGWGVIHVQISTVKTVVPITFKHLPQCIFLPLLTWKLRPRCILEHRIYLTARKENGHFSLKGTHNETEESNTSMFPSGIHHSAADLSCQLVIGLPTEIHLWSVCWLKLLNVTGAVCPWEPPNCSF